VAATGGSWNTAPTAFMASKDGSARERLAQTFEWDGMPGYVAVTTSAFEDLGNGRTRVTSTTLFHTTEERDGMLHSGMEDGLNESYAALDRLLSRAGGR
jgi:uncharacterized protein YndB with AHSA1/START domain